MKKKMISLLFVFVLAVSAFANTAFADYYSARTTLYKGMRSSEVVNLQNDLKSLGYFNTNSTGYFGDLTYQAVIAYQRSNSLAADGIVGPRTAREIKVDRVIQTAKQYQGVPYLWGGTSPKGFDCSGFTHYVFLKNGIEIPRVTKDQYNRGTSVSKSQLKPGDLVFFTTYAPGPSHVGIYLGGNKFIHASSGANKITISDLNNSYYAQRYIGARRIIQ